MRIKAMAFAAGALVSGLALAQTPHDTSPRFLAGAEDVPLAPQLIEVGEPVLFESPTGAMLVSEATGRTSADAVRQFYRSTLPALGWRPDGMDRYRREMQTLTLALRSLDGGAGDVRASFTLVTASPSAETAPAN